MRLHRGLVDGEHHVKSLVELGDGGGEVVVELGRLQAEAVLAATDQPVELPPRGAQLQVAHEQLDAMADALEVTGV